MNAQYHAMATILLAACPAGIDRAWIDASVEDGHVHARYWYEQAGERRQPKIDPTGSFRIAQALSEVRESWPTRPLWSNATFTLFPDGQFKLDVHGDAPVEQ